MSSLFVFLVLATWSLVEGNGKEDAEDGYCNDVIEAGGCDQRRGDTLLCAVLIIVKNHARRHQHGRGDSAKCEALCEAERPWEVEKPPTGESNRGGFSVLRAKS